MPERYICTSEDVCQLAMEKKGHPMFDGVSKPAKRPSHELWRKLCVAGYIFAFVVTGSFIIWTHFNPTMGYYAFKSAAPQCALCYG